MTKHIDLQQPDEDMHAPTRAVPWPPVDPIARQHIEILDRAGERADALALGAAEALDRARVDELSRA